MNPSTAADVRTAGTPLSPLLILFFFSGASALVYQVLWMRLLALVFGVTVHAASTVLAAFMLGLALGSAVAGRVADRVQRPLRAFALVEALVAVAALTTPVLLAAIEVLYVRLHGLLGGAPGLMMLIRLVLSFAVVVVPTAMMGATLPLVVKSALGRGAILGRQVSLLYAINTAGAIVGALTAGIWLVPQLGITWSFRIAATVNLLIAAGALVLSMRRSAQRIEATSPGPLPPGSSSASDRASFDPVVRRLVLLTFAVSGFASFALEIVWFRMLVVLLRPTTYAFTVMLATVLAGLAIGSWLATPLVSRRRIQPLLLLALLELLLASAAVLSMFAIGHAGVVYGRVAPLFADGSMNYLGPVAAISATAILPAALLMGMAFPIGIAIWAGDVPPERAGERIGTIYAVNVAGAVGGSLLTGFLFLPLLGSRTSLLLIAGLTLTTGLLLLTRVQGRWRAGALGVAALALFAALATRAGDPVLELLRTRYPAETLAWRGEDGHATVTILRRASAFAHPVRRLYINGMHQASDEPGMVAYHRLIGTLPMAIHSDPRTALVVGAGGGATAGAVAAFSERVAVDVVELSPAVLRAAREFGAINHDLLQRPNVRARVDDGRNYMLLTDMEYDVITADVILPMHAGAGNLYSAEYYQLMRNVLQNRGIAVQWIGSGTETEYKLIMRTFLQVFPHTTLWENGTLMVGATRPLVLEEEAFLQKQASPQSKAALDLMGLTSFEQLLSRYVAGPAELQQFVGEGMMLTDDRPLTEYFLALPQNDSPVDLSSLRGDVNRHVLRASRATIVD